MKKNYAGGGLFTLLVSVVGLCATSRRSLCLLVFYALCLCLAFLVLVAGNFCQRDLCNQTLSLYFVRSGMLHSCHIRHPRGDRLERDRPLRHAAPHQGLRQDPSGHLHLGLLARSAQNFVIWDDSPFAKAATKGSLLFCCMTCTLPGINRARDGKKSTFVG